MSDFGNPILIGGRYNVLATEIYAQVIGMSNFAAGATMSVVLIVPCLAAYLLNAYWVGTRSYVTVSAGARTAVEPTPTAGRSPLARLPRGHGRFFRAYFAPQPPRAPLRPSGGDLHLSQSHHRIAPWPH